MKKKVLLLAIIVVVAAILVGVALKGNKQASHKETVRVGAILPLTGDFAALGSWFKLGFQVAEDQINSVQETPLIKVVFEDGRSDVNNSIAAYRKLVHVDGIKIIVTTTSPVCLALKPLAETDKVLLFANAAHPSITAGNNPLVFRHSNAIAQEGELISAFLERNMQPDKSSVWIVYLNNEFGLGFREFLTRRLRDRVGGFESYEANQTDFKNLASKVLAAGPKYLIVVGFTKNLGGLIRSFRELGFRGEIFCNFGFTTPGVTDIAGEGAKGVHYVDYSFSVASGAQAELANLARKKYNADLTPVGILAYNVVRIIATAARETRTSDPSALANAIRKRGQFTIDGLRLEVTSTGDILPPMEVKRHE